MLWTRTLSIGIIFLWTTAEYQGKKHSLKMSLYKFPSYYVDLTIKHAFVNNVATIVHKLSDVKTIKSFLWLEYWMHVPSSNKLLFMLKVSQLHFRFASVCLFLTWRTADREQHKHRKPVGIIRREKGWASTHQPWLPRSSARLPPFLDLHVWIYTIDTSRGGRWNECNRSPHSLIGHAHNPLEGQCW